MKKINLLILILGLALFSGCVSNNGIYEIKDALITQDIVGYKTDQAECFMSSYSVDIDRGDNYTYIKQTNGKRISMELRKITITDLGTSNVEIEADLYENVSTINRGDELPIFNQNRDYVNVNCDNNTLFIYNNSTIDTSNATYLRPLSEFLTSEKTQASFLNKEVKYIMARNTTYALRVNNVGQGDANVRIVWKWCENERIR